MKKHVPLALSALLGLLSVLVILLRLGYPHQGVVALVVYGVGWASFVWWLRRQRAVTAGAAGKLRQHGRAMLGALALLLVGYVIYVLFPVKQGTFLAISEADLRALVATDLAATQRLSAAHDRALGAEDGIAPLAGKKFTELSEAERRRLLGFWSAFVDRTIAIETLVGRHRSFYQINYLRHPDLNLRSFLVGYAALLANIKGGLALRALVGDNDTLATALDEGRAELGIPARSYSRIASGLIEPETMILLNAGRAHLSFARRTGQLEAAEERSLIAACDTRFEEIYRLLGKAPDVVVDEPLRVYEQTTFRLWFPVQKEIAEAMGDIRTARRQYLITPTQAHDLRVRLEPGDIILERRNWFLSNLGLPGFWPHVALYTGDLAELDRTFSGLAGLQGRTFSAYAAAELPEILRRYREKGASGYAPSVLEAVSEGVILQEFELSAAADYLAVLRPRLDKEDKLQALLTAFSFVGRPYDFNFDFVTDNALVCSEVVYKAYLPGAGRRGLHFQIETASGRQVLPPNSMARKFDEELGAPGQELDFVLFLDGSEAEGRTVERDQQALRQTWQRPKWDVVQE